MTVRPLKPDMMQQVSIADVDFHYQLKECMSYETEEIG